MIVRACVLALAATAALGATPLVSPTRPRDPTVGDASGLSDPLRRLSRHRGHFGAGGGADAAGAHGQLPLYPTGKGVHHSAARRGAVDAFGPRAHGRYEFRGVRHRRAGGGRSRPALPYTVAEVARPRRQPLTNTGLTAYRNQVVAGLAVKCQFLAALHVYAAQVASSR